jgi:Trp operon repressor
MQYDEPNLIKIAGQGRKGIEIYEEYMKLYEDGYDLSVNSACDYLGCSYRYFITHLIDKIKHIRINTTGRKLILLYCQLEQLEPEVLSIFSKRILIDRNDFHDFLKNNIIIEQKYKVFYDIILKSDVADAIRDNLKIYNSRLSKNQPPRDIKSIFEFAIFKISSTENEVVRYRLLNESNLPEKLYSIKEIINHYGYSSSMQVYRIIDKLGVKRYILDHFVRYDLSEFDKTSDSILKMDYKSYLDLSKNADVEKKIAEQALKYSQKLVQSGML